MDELRSFNNELSDLIIQKPTEYMPVFSDAAQEVVQRLTVPRPKIEEMAHIQVKLNNFPRTTPIRNLNAKDVSSLVCVRGIVVSAGKARIKATKLKIMCRNCKLVKSIKCSAGFGVARLPRVCDTQAIQGDGSGMEKCPLDPYMILADTSEYIDQQRLKLQENPEEVPTGEMPRHISLSLDRYLVGEVKPGARITVVGIFTTFQARGGRKRDQKAAVGTRIPYLQVLGTRFFHFSTSNIFWAYCAY